MTANDPPLIAGVIHGVRVWRTRLDGRRPRLAAAAQGSAWVPGGLPTRAACLVGEGHPAPAGECACGLYALHPHTLETTASFFSFPGYHRGALWIAGLVEAWGRIEVHAEGFRAQYARPIALLAMGLPRHGEYHRLAAEAAAAYRVELLQLESPAQVAAHCREHDLGLSREVVRSLVSEPPEDAPPTLVGAPTPPGPAPPRSRLQEIGELLGLGAFGLMMLVWYSGIGLILIASAIGMVSGLGDEGGSEFSSRHLRVLDERLVRFDGSLSYIAIVRDTSDEKVALAAFPRGKVVDADGEEVVSIQERERIDLRPSLGPGETGVVIDRLGRSRDVDVDRRLRYETEILAHRRPAPDGYRPSLTFSRPELVRAPCGVTARVDARADVRRASIALLLFDRAGKIVSAGWTHAGPFEEGRSRERIAGGGGKHCPSQFASVAAYPNPTPDKLMGEGP